MKKNSLLITITSCLVMSQAHAIEPVYDGEDGIRAMVFETNCLGCHSSELSGANRNGAPDGADFDTYSEASKNGGGAVSRGVTAMDMPPASVSNALTDEQKQALKNWKVLGFPKAVLPTVYSADTAELSLPQVYLKDANGDITLQWKANMKLISGSNPVQFELLNADEISAPEE
jgi:cytochrome c5